MEARFRHIIIIIKTYANHCLSMCFVVKLRLWGIMVSTLNIVLKGFRLFVYTQSFCFVFMTTAIQLLTVS